MRISNLIWLAIAVVFTPTKIFAQDPAVELAQEIYFGVNNFNAEQHAQAMTQMILQRQPTWQQSQSVIVEKATEILSDEEYQLEIAKVVAKHFSYQDLVELKKLMSHPVMKKWNTKLPEILPDLTIATTDHLMPAMFKLITDIQLETNTLNGTKDYPNANNPLIGLLKKRQCAELHQQADQMLKINNHDVYALYSKAICNLVIEKKYQESLDNLLKIQEINPKYRHINLNMAQAYLWLGEERKAIDYAIKDANLYPYSSASLNMLGKVYGHLGNKDESIKYFKTSIQYDPKHINSYLEWAVLHFSNGEKQEACDILLQAEQINPKIANIPLKQQACG